MNNNNENLQIPDIMKNFSMKYVLILIFTFISLIFIANIVKNIYTEYLWFYHLSYQDVYFKILRTKIYLFLGSFFTSFVFLSISSYLAFRSSWKGVQFDLPEPFNLIGPKVYKTILVLLVVGTSIALGLSTSYNWELFLRYFNSTTFSISDPIFSRDVSFYIFDYPIYTFIQRGLLIISILALIYGLAIIFVNSVFAGQEFNENTILKKQSIINFSIRLILFSLGILFYIWSLLNFFSLKFALGRQM